MTEMYIRSWHSVFFPALISFALVAVEIPSSTWMTTAAFSLASGVSALSLMALSAVLAARWSIVESWFGGLDRVYQAHKWMGIWALGFASFHLVFKAGTDAWDTASILPLSPALTRFVRQLSYVALIFIVLLALNRKIPYSVWRWWHKLSGPLFLIVVLHWLSFRTPIVLVSPAGIWLATASFLGVASATYKLVFHPFVSNHREYEVSGISPGAGAMQLELKPVGRAIDFEAGQFGFLRMKEEGLREPHPFTIASSKTGDGSVHFLIRGLGDYTQKLLDRVSVGMRADIYAPYGRFRRGSKSKREVWIAGGVGISPFVAWLKDVAAPDFSKVTLFYFHAPGRDFPSTETMREMVAARGAELVPITKGRISQEFGERFAAIAKECEPAGIGVSFCGPKGLLKQVRGHMQRHGIPASNLRYEHFEFR